MNVNSPINAKLLVRKVRGAIMMGNTHIGATDLDPLINQCKLLGIPIPRTVKMDPLRPRQYYVQGAVDVMLKIAPVVGQKFDMSMVPETLDERDEFAITPVAPADVVAGGEQPTIPASDPALVADLPGPTLADQVADMDKAELLQRLKSSKVVRTAAGMKVTPEMEKDDLVELVTAHYEKRLNHQCYAEEEGELANARRTRPPKPPARVSNMNKTQLRKWLDEAEIDYDNDSTKAVLVAQVEAAGKGGEE